MSDYKLYNLNTLFYHPELWDGKFLHLNGISEFSIADIIYSEDQKKFVLRSIYEDQPEKIFTHTYSKFKQVKKLATTTDNKEKEITMDLFEIKKDENTILFGTKLAENSAGDWVMEVKGTSEVIAVKPSLCEKVVPYTIKVCLLTKHTHHHLKVSKSHSLVEGDLLLLNTGGLASVAELDTKCETTSDNLIILKKITAEDIV